MGRIRLVLAFALLASLGGKPAFAAPPGFAFLEIPTGARASALGGAFASLGSGVEASFWNPAGLEGVKGIQVAAGHTEYLQKLRHDHFAIAGNLFGGGLSGSIRALYSEPIEERDAIGNLVGSFGAHDFEIGLGYGHPIGSGIAIGGSIVAVRERISNLAATTYAAGVGATWEPPSWSGLRVGFQASGLGPPAHYTFDGTAGDPVSLPAAVQAGATYRFGATTGWGLQTALETRVTRGRSGVGIVGAEISHAAGAALRFGYRANDSATSFSAGAGYTLQRLHLDYAFVPLDADLGDTHRISLSAQF